MLLSALDLPFLNELGANFGYVLTGLLAGCAAYMGGRVKEWWTQRRKCRDATQEAQRNLELSSLLREMRAVAGASRGALVRFHNGECYLDGDPLKRFSVLHEAMGPGEGSVCSRLQNLPIALLPPDMTLRPDEFSVAVFTEQMPDGFFKSEMTAMGLGHLVSIPLRKNSRVVGFLWLGYRDDQPRGCCQEWIKDVSRHVRLIELCLFMK
jgi:hypothetical protein